MNDKAFSWTIGIIVVLGVGIYTYFNNNKVHQYFNKPPYVSIEDSSLVIEDFNWNIGMVGFNLVAGDFNGLNEKVYNTLKGKSGKYEVILRNHREDKFGKTYINTDRYGKIDADELNQYESADYWMEDKGMAKIIVPEINTTLTQLDNIPDQLHKSKEPVKTPPPPVNGSNTEPLAVYEVKDAFSKDWIYYQQINGHFTPIEREASNYKDFANYWEVVTGSIKHIEIKVYEYYLVATFLNTDGTIKEFELKPIVGQVIYGTYTGNFQVGFQLSSERYVFLRDGDRSVVIKTDN